MRCVALLNYVKNPSADQKLYGEIRYYHIETIYKFRGAGIETIYKVRGAG